MTDTATLICPKCRGEMHTYERNGILVDQCQECRGIFLDRGELEQLIDAEHAREPDDERRTDSGDRDRPLDREHDDHRHGRRRSKRSSLIADLLGGGE